MKTILINDGCRQYIPIGVMYKVFLYSVLLYYLCIDYIYVAISFYSSSSYLRNCSQRFPVVAGRFQLRVSVVGQRFVQCIQHQC